MISLYQFPISHFCEKARWALDHKGLAFTPVDLLPGFHLLATRKLKAPAATLPIIVDGERMVQDSTAIITYLDRQYPEHPLTPADPALAAEALEWEEYLDEEIGASLRVWIYFHLLPDRRRVLDKFLPGTPPVQRIIFPLIFPLIRVVMIKKMNLGPDTFREAEQRMLAAMDRLDGVLSGGRRFLAGDGFSRADLTAASLLAPLCLPGKSDAEAAAFFPEAVLALRERLKSRPFFPWVLEIYRDHRRPAGAAA